MNVNLSIFAVFSMRDAYLNQILDHHVVSAVVFWQAELHNTKK